MSNNALTGAILWTLAALVGLALILAAVRFMRGSRQGTYVAGGRNRRPRLAVIDATPVDTQRRLVLIRRDHVEHLVLIGGQSDLVIERGIPIAPQPQQVAPPPQTAAAVQRPMPMEPASPEPVTSYSERPIVQPEHVAPTASSNVAGGVAAGSVAASAASAQERQESLEPAPMSAREVYEQQAAELRERERQQASVEPEMEQQQSLPSHSVAPPSEEEAIANQDTASEEAVSIGTDMSFAEEPRIDLPEPQQEWASVSRAEPYFTMPAPDQHPSDAAPDAPHEQPAFVDQRAEAAHTGQDMESHVAVEPEPATADEPQAELDENGEEDPDLTLEREMSRLLDDLGDDRNTRS
ncbi:flagellar biosynthetic protein FliO [Nitratireductor basaltis]|nr:flagellar biosynthetic protein FliO [Nitratireductor basaltis]